jgi:hypothetical protein
MEMKDMTFAGGDFLLEKGAASETSSVDSVEAKNLKKTVSSLAIAMITFSW